MRLTEFEGGGQEDGEDGGGGGGSKIPWKIRAARRRAGVRHHTTGMTKDEFAKIRQSLQESARRRGVIGKQQQQQQQQH